MLWSVAGSSCSGKTTAARACAGIPGLVVHDFDEIGVPPGADVAWRQRSLEQWVRRVVAYQEEGLDVLLTSQSPLGELLAAPSVVLVDGIAACLLDVADDERLRRLDERDPGKWSPREREAFVGWGRWHRGHAADPRHQPEILTRGGWPEMVWERWASWRAGDPRWSVTVIDTTARPVTDSASQLRRWMKAGANQ